MVRRETAVTAVHAPKYGDKLCNTAWKPVWALDHWVRVRQQCRESCAGSPAIAVR